MFNILRNYQNFFHRECTILHSYYNAQRYIFLKDTGSLRCIRRPLFFCLASSYTSFKTHVRCSLFREPFLNIPYIPRQSSSLPHLYLAWLCLCIYSIHFNVPHWTVNLLRVGITLDLHLSQQHQSIRKCSWAEWKLLSNLFLQISGLFIYMEIHFQPYSPSKYSLDKVLNLNLAWGACTVFSLFSPHSCLSLYAPAVLSYC